MIGHELNVLQSVRAFVLSLLQVRHHFTPYMVVLYILDITGLRSTQGVMATEPGNYGTCCVAALITSTLTRH